LKPGDTELRGSRLRHRAEAAVSMRNLKAEGRLRLGFRLREGADLLASEKRVLVNETDSAAERVLGIKQALTPRQGGDRFVDESARGLDACQRLFQVGHRKIEVLMRMKAPAAQCAIAISEGIVARKESVPARKVMATGRDTLAGILKDCPIEAGGLLNIGHGKDHTVQVHDGYIVRKACRESRR
jgi:hypothetical protein